MDEVALARRCLPPQLVSPAIDRWGHVRWSWSPDACAVELIELEPGPDDVAVHRQVWWFDGETAAWSLDQADSWYLPAESARYLVEALGAWTASARNVS